MMVTFTVNGRSVTVDVPSDMPLLWVLRDVLDVKGPKFGCGVAQCGACTVHLNGAATRSCVLPAAAIEGADVKTIEGLSTDGTHPLQRAWQELDVPQCGYCQAGQIMSAAALLERTPQPTDAQIDAAMNGNLCRCATYLRIRQAIHRAAQIATDSPAGGGGGSGGGGVSNGTGASSGPTGRAPSSNGNGAPHDAARTSTSTAPAAR
jgi:isoquinoline 1-oxidoreductase alpha subunit